MWNPNRGAAARQAKLLWASGLILSVAIHLGILGGVVYVAWHFIAKYW